MLYDSGVWITIQIVYSTLAPKLIIWESLGWQVYFEIAAENIGIVILHDILKIIFPVVA